MKPVRLPPENPGPDCLLQTGKSLDLVDAALDGGTEADWEAAVDALHEAEYLAREALAVLLQEEALRSREAGQQRCAKCLAWKPPEEVREITYGAEASSKGGTTRRYFLCRSCDTEAAA